MTPDDDHQAPPRLSNAEARVAWAKARIIRERNEGIAYARAVMASPDQVAHLKAQLAGVTERPARAKGAVRRDELDGLSLADLFRRLASKVEGWHLESSNGACPPRMVKLRYAKGEWDRSRLNPEWLWHSTDRELVTLELPEAWFQ